MALKKNIILIGFMGTGKSSVGKILARLLERSLVDVDEAIEKKEKMKIGDIFEKKGEAHFRRLEKKAIRDAVRQFEAVITTGGGAVLDAENRKALKRAGTVIALVAKPETIYERVRNSRRRPLLQKGDLMSQIKVMLKKRAPFYEEADFFFETDGKNSAEVAKAIVSQLALEVG